MPNVVLATGGFEHNEAFTKAFLRGPLHNAVSIRTNTGDGLRMAMKAGAMLGTMREAWWMPIVEAPVNAMGMMLFTGERTLPGSDHDQSRRQALLQRGGELPNSRRVSASPM